MVETNTFSMRLKSRIRYSSHTWNDLFIYWGQKVTKILTMETLSQNLSDLYLAVSEL